jgi:hypothetical protein
MTPTTLFLDWLQQYVDTSGYSMSRGMWVESSVNSGKKYVAVWINSGRAPVAGVVQYPQIRLIVAGTHGGRDKGETPAVELFADGILNSAIENPFSGCVTNIRPIGSIQGPYYTEAGRPWYEMNFEMII